MIDSIDKTINKPIHYGLDIGGTKMEIALFSHDFELLDSWRLPTPINDYQDFIQTIEKMVDEADLKSNHKGTLGIGLPGVISKFGCTKSSNVPCLTGKDITKDLKNLLNRDLAVSNDSRLFALSEANSKNTHQYKRLYGAILGTGAAGGFCIDGAMYQGKNNLAGEYGHIGISGVLLQRYNLPIRACGCGLEGCYETYVAGPGLNWLWQLFNKDSNKISTTFDFVAQLRAKNPIALKTFECYMDILGASFSTIVLSYDPDLIVIGGGLSNINEIIDALPSAINKHLFEGAEAPLIRRADFGDSSGVRGAALIGNQHANL